MDINKNNFIKTAYRLFDTLDAIADIPYIGYNGTITKNIFGKVLYKEPVTLKNTMDPSDYDDCIRNIGKVNTIYNEAKKDITNVESPDFPLVIKQYIAFIKTMEKVFMFTNDETLSPIYADVDKQLEKQFLYLDNDEYKIKFTFQDSRIDMPGSEDIPDDDDYIGFMRSDDKPKSKTVIFIDIDVERLYGARMFTNYKFIHASSLYQDDDESDRVLLKVINNITSRMILDHFRNILCNIIPKMSLLADHEDWYNDTLKNFYFYKAVEE